MLVNPNQRNQSPRISYKGGARSMIRTLANSDALASTIFLESFVTGGRSLNAYKRGGFPEFRERFTDDFVSAVFWMKGVDIFNKIGDKIGKHVLKLPISDFDLGKDALRNPIKNISANVTKDIAKQEEAKKVVNKLLIFKSTKIILSSLLAIGFVGFCLPKINQTITSKLMNKKQTKDKEQSKLFDLSKIMSPETFEQQIEKQRTKNPAFKGIPTNFITTIGHNLENNKICKMLTCDSGILTGRVLTARNKDEGREYFFRDIASSFFYFASTPLIYKFLQKISDSTNYTNIDPVAAEQLYNNFVNQLNKVEGKSLGIKEFKEKIMGVTDDKAKELLTKLPFKSDVISFNELKEHIKDVKLIEKASKMAELQPEISGIGKVLTKQQVEDVFKNGSINTPEFMQKIFKEKFKDKLTNPYKYIPMKKITSFRKNIDEYAESIIKEAQKNNGIINIELLNKMNKKSFAFSMGFRMVAMGISAFALGFAIPKIQYAITKKRTGKNEAPGLRQYNNKE